MENQLFLTHLIKGEKQAIEQLVLTYRDSVYRTCLAYVQNQADAEDLTQEVFVKLFEKLDQFKGQSKLSTWIIRIAINLSLNYLRDNKKRLNQLDVSEYQIIDQENESQNTLQTRKMVRYAIQKLPEKQREVFILSFYLELSYKEIADITGYSISSIESLLFRSRKNLKDFLQQFYNELNS
jgi:RNA polymerase sigma factor (sigma-70 family)